MRSTIPRVSKNVTRGECKAHGPGTSPDANKRVRKSDREDETDVANPRDKSVRTNVRSMRRHRVRKADTLKKGGRARPEPTHGVTAGSNTNNPGRLYQES